MKKATIEHTTDRLCPYRLTVDEKTFDFPHHTAAVNYAKSRFSGIEIYDRTKGEKA